MYLFSNSVQEFLCPDQLEMLASELFTANNEKKDKQCLLDTPRTVMVNKENYYQEYKMAKFDK